MEREREIEELLDYLDTGAIEYAGRRSTARSVINALIDKAKAEAEWAVDGLSAQSSKQEYVAIPIAASYRDATYTERHKDFLSGIYAGYSAARGDALTAIRQQKTEGGTNDTQDDIPK